MGKEVTRRPGDEKYSLLNEKGHTRLSIMEELRITQNDKGFMKVECQYVPWHGGLKTVK